MKLERLHESVLPVIAILSGLLLAIFVGSLAGTGNTGSVGLVIAVIVAVGFFLFVRQRMWMLIPATGMLDGQITVLPLPFTVAHLSILFAFGTFLLLKAFKIVRLKPKLGLADIWMFIVLAYLATVFARNPVGVEALASERVGGRPYVSIIIAFLGSWVLARSVATVRDAFWFPLLVVAGNGFHLVINEIAYRFPSTVGPLSRLYNGIAAAENPDALPALPGEGSNRKGHYGGVGSALWQLACTRWRPMTLINPLYFGRFLIFLFAVYSVFQSGFRSAVISMMLMFLMATYFRRGIGEVIQATLFLVLAVMLLVAMQGTIIDLPLPAQRALSFLPGHWDYMAKKEAEGSTQWRVEMWKQMLSGNKYIENKWLGDGFGFTRAQLQIMLANTINGSNEDQQENLMISGGVHSGPITAIRYVGYVGLALFMVFLIFVAIRAVRLIHRSEGTPFYPLALFLGLPSIVHPFTYVLIFGAYEADLPHAIMAVGLQKLLENSLDAYAAIQKKEETPTPVQPAIPKFRRPPHFAPLPR